MSNRALTQRQLVGPLVDQKEGEDRGGTDDQTRRPADGGGASVADHRDDSDRPFSERVGATDGPGQR